MTLIIFLSSSNVAKKRNTRFQGDDLKATLL